MKKMENMQIEKGNRGSRGNRHKNSYAFLSFSKNALLVISIQFFCYQNSGIKLLFFLILQYFRLKLFGKLST